MGFADGSVVKNLPGLGRSHRTAKPLHHSYWACVLEPATCNPWAHVLYLLKPTCCRARALRQGKTLQWEAHAVQLESSSHSRQLEKKPVQQAVKTQHNQKQNPKTNKQKSPKNKTRGDLKISNGFKASTLSHVSFTAIILPSTVKMPHLCSLFFTGV